MDSVRTRAAPRQEAHPEDVHEFVRRLTEGTRWGTVVISPATGGGLYRRVRLRVYSPGTTQSERRALHFAHTWPIAGGVTAVILTAALSHELPPTVGLVTALLVYAAGFWLAVRLTRPLKGGIRTLTVASVHSFDEPQEFGDGRLLHAVTTRLDDLESRRRSGDVTEVQYEAEWWDIYEMIPGPTADLIQGR
jgi:hypothetical protein